MKGKVYLKIFLLLIISCFAIDSFGQDVPTIKQKQEQRNFFRKNLLLDSIKAEQVMLIQATYKAALANVMADTTVRGTKRQEKIQGLMDKKNLELRKFLTPAQQEKIIPLSEQRLSQPIKKD